jgi:hypothetical protein
VGNKTKICEVRGNEETEYAEMKRQQHCGWRHFRGSPKVAPEMIVTKSLGGTNPYFSALVT